jgi:FkbM family methyltransferase
VRRWLNAGAIQIPMGLAHGMWLWKADLPLSHAHLGSLAFGNLETSVQEAMLRHLAPGDVFYDIGANLGFFSLLGARLVDGDGRVCAFEPAPANAAAIRRNVELNGLTNVEVLEHAVSERGGIGQLQVVEDQSWSKLAEYGPHPNTESVLNVELVSIDDLVREARVPPPDMVKLDVEGAEIAALRGMRDTVAAHRPAIICELHDTHGPFLELMRSWGYRVINVEGAGPIEEAGPSAHALALPGDHAGD